MNHIPSKSEGTTKPFLYNPVYNIPPTEVVSKGITWMLFEYFSVSDFSFDHVLYIFHAILHLNVTHNCPAKWILVKFVYVNLCTQTDATERTNNKSLKYFVKSRIVIYPDSYTLP